MRKICVRIWESCGGYWLAIICGYQVVDEMEGLCVAGASVRGGLYVEATRVRYMSVTWMRQRGVGLLALSVN